MRIFDFYFSLSQIYSTRLYSWAVLKLFRLAVLRLCRFAIPRFISPSPHPCEFSIFTFHFRKFILCRFTVGRFWNSAVLQFCDFVVSQSPDSSHPRRIRTNFRFHFSLSKIILCRFTVGRFCATSENKPRSVWLSVYDIAVPSFFSPHPLRRALAIAAAMIEVLFHYYK